MENLPIIEASFDDSKIKQRNSYIVVLLGAGASKDVGMPICNDLLSNEYINELDVGPDEIDILNKYENCGVGFEELLATQLESGNINEFDTLLKYYEEIFLASETYSGGSGVDEHSTQWMDRFQYYIGIAVLLKSWSKRGIHPIVITFNHDLWLEYAFMWNEFNYGSLTNRIFCFENTFPSMPKFGDLCTILKLHGSFNYTACGNCQSIMCIKDYAWKFPISVCPRCKVGSHKNLYIPPTKDKDYKSLNDAWSDAYYYIQKAESLLVIGYSMPKYDIHARELVQAMPPDSPVYIVDKYAQYTTANYGFLKNRSRLYYSIGTKDFVEETMIHGGIPARKFKFF